MASYMDDDMVCSAWQHAAARKGGRGVTNHVEQKAFGNHMVVLHRHIRNTCVMAIDPSYWAVGFLDGPFVEQYAKREDGTNRHMAAEWCLISRNEAASAIVDALATP